MSYSEDDYVDDIIRQGESNEYFSAELDKAVRYQNRGILQRAVTWLAQRLFGPIIQDWVYSLIDWVVDKIWNRYFRRW